MSRNFRRSEAQRMREEVCRCRMDVTRRRFKGEETCGRYNLHGVRRRGSATIQTGKERSDAT
jgi:hypothetical protein